MQRLKTMASNDLHRWSIKLRNNYIWTIQLNENAFYFPGSRKAFNVGIFDLRCRRTCLSLSLSLLLAQNTITLVFCIYRLCPSVWLTFSLSVCMHVCRFVKPRVLGGVFPCEIVLEVEVYLTEGFKQICSIFIISTSHCTNKYCSVFWAFLVPGSCNYFDSGRGIIWTGLNCSTAE